MSAVHFEKVPVDLPCPGTNDFLYSILVALASASNGTVAIDQTTPGASTVNTVLQGVATNRGGSITAGGTAQTLAAANSTRKRFLVQNTSSADLWIEWFGGTASVGGTDSYRLGPNTGAYEMPPNFCTTAAITIIGATTGQTWTAEEF